MAEAGYEFNVITPDESIEASFDQPLPPTELVAELANRKAQAVAEELSGVDGGCIVLAADTIAECDGRILGKPKDESDARAMLSWMSGRQHYVLSGVCMKALAGGLQTSEETVVVSTTLQMAPLTEDWLEPYLKTGKWAGKAGAFGFQDGLGFVEILEGSESNVVGLPMERVSLLLAERGCLPASRYQS